MIWHKEMDRFHAFHCCYKSFNIFFDHFFSRYKHPISYLLNCIQFGFFFVFTCAMYYTYFHEKERRRIGTRRDLNSQRILLRLDAKLKIFRWLDITSMNRFPVSLSLSLTKNHKLDPLNFHHRFWQPWTETRMYYVVSLIYAGSYAGHSIDRTFQSPVFVCECAPFQ